MEYYNVFVEWYRIRYWIRYRMQYRIRYLYYSSLCSMFLPWDSQACSKIDVLECQGDSISPLAFLEIGHTPTGRSRTCGDGREDRRQDCQWWSWWTRNSTRLRSTRGLVWEGYPIDHKGWTHWQSIQPAWLATIAAAPGHWFFLSESTWSRSKIDNREPASAHCQCPCSEQYIQSWSRYILLYTCIYRYIIVYTIFNLLIPDDLLH